ncbi:MAG: hypothetical protein GXX99_04865, partial [Clostridiales bacterium]|nr:hypothetical protein [Clostridiales bacterium]
LDQLFPFETACEQVGAGFEGGAFLGDCRLTEFSYQVGIGASITVEAKLSCRAVARVRKTYSTAAAIEVEPAGGNAPQRCLTLYYPVEGESLWEIGKRYTTPIREIVNVNMLESEEIPNNLKMLLIPR